MTTAGAGWYTALVRQAHVNPCQCGSGQPGAHCQRCRSEAEGCSGIPQPDIDPARCTVCLADQTTLLPAATACSVCGHQQSHHIVWPNYTEPVCAICYLATSRDPWHGYVAPEVSHG